MKGSLDTLRKVRGIYYSWFKPKDSSGLQMGTQVGLIAQDVLEDHKESADLVQKTNELGVNYASLVSHLIEAVRELNERVDRSVEKIKQHRTLYEVCERRIEYYSNYVRRFETLNTN